MVIMDAFVLLSVNEMVRVVLAGLGKMLMDEDELISKIPEVIPTITVSIPKKHQGLSPTHMTCVPGLTPLKILENWCVFDESK